MTRRLAAWRGLVTAIGVAGTLAAGASRAHAQAGGSGGAREGVPERFRVAESDEFRRAVERGTRLRSGAPGPRYWQQWAEYRLEAELNVPARRLTGRGSVRYRNNSPDTLRSVWVHLYSNLFEDGARKNQPVPNLGGIELLRVGAGGVNLLPDARKGDPGYTVDGTRAEVRLPAPLAPGGSVELTFSWRLRIQPENAPRGGNDGDVFYVSYWYPQVAVYDDLGGWQIDPYLGRGEFYMGYARYDVRVTVPAGWLVQSTGRLVNADSVLRPTIVARLDSARRTSEVVRVVRDEELGQATLATARPTHTWHFVADSTRDVTWGASGRYLWDVARTLVGDSLRPDTVMSHALYRPEARRAGWAGGARYVRHAVEFLSRNLWAYPYPHMSALDGPAGCGGMEYPMMTCIGDRGDSLALYRVISHETGHMWFPMVVGSDEKRYAWQDEGFTQYWTALDANDFLKGSDDEAENRDLYRRLATQGADAVLMKPADRYGNDAEYGNASYYKTASALVALRSVLGGDVLQRAFREYGRRWRFRHPSPYDFWYTVEEVAGRELDWFWTPWWFETWKLDMAIDTVVPAAGDSADIVIQNRGRVPMPLIVELTRVDGTKERVTLPERVWFGGERRTALRVRNSPALRRVVLDPDGAYPWIPDGTRSWPGR